MKKSILTVLLFCVSLAASADERGEAVVRAMTAAVKSLGDYAVRFTVVSGDVHAEGRYAVAGKGYAMTLGSVDVYCDGAVRYEINKEYKEITVDRLDPSDHNILNNPVGGLDFVGEDCRAELVSENGSERVVRLALPNGNVSIVLDVAVDAVSHLPRRLEYRMADGKVSFTLNDIRHTSDPLPRFDAAKYPDFEIIDFR